MAKAFFVFNSCCCYLSFQALILSTKLGRQPGRRKKRLGYGTCQKTCAQALAWLLLGHVAVGTSLHRFASFSSSLKMRLIIHTSWSFYEDGMRNKSLEELCKGKVMGRSEQKFIYWKPSLLLVPCFGSEVCW